MPAKIFQCPFPDYGSMHDPSHNPSGIIVHAMGEVIRHEDGDFDAHRFLVHIGLSVHCLVYPNGTAAMGVDPKRIAWHSKGFNTGYLGIEFLVPGTHDYNSFSDRIAHKWLSRRQYLTGVYIMASWAAQYPISRDRIRRHSDVDPSRKIDPGNGFPFTQLVDSVMNLSHESFIATNGD